MYSLFQKIYNRLNIHNDFLVPRNEMINRIITNSVLSYNINSYLINYRGIYKGKKICIVGCGPSIERFKNEFNFDILIGINRAFYFKQFNFDFLFAQDQFKEGFDDFTSYRNESCKKFIAMITNDVDYKINNYSLSQINGYRYVLDCIVMNKIHTEISYFPFADLKGTVFSALQFALYTCPSEIYLVGFDCDNTGNYVSKDKTNYNFQFKSWKVIKKFIEINYPAIKIYSINPVGLKGLFNDIYL